MENLSKEDMGNMMSQMMEKCCAEMSEDDKRMVNECCAKGDVQDMPEMMKVMMPHCLNMMLPNISKENRVDFVMNIVTTLMEQGSRDMTAQEKKDFITKVTDRVMT